MGDRKGFSAAYNAGHLSTDLIRTDRSFDLGLIVPDQIEAVRSNTADPVKNKNSLIAAVENHIAAAKLINGIRFNDGFIPSGMKKRIHTVALRFQLDGGTIF